MSVQSTLNNLLNPVLFQVIGSTPESICDAIMSSNLKNNATPALQLAAIAVFAAAVNKPTMENFISKPELYEARPFINAIFSISGRANMTGLTLLGHCLLTTDHMNSVNFCSELRKKMGQRSLWDGELDGGSLSEQQRKIMKEKKRLTPERTARLLGSGFFKHAGIDRSAMTEEELDFWKTPNAGTGYTAVAAGAGGTQSGPGSMAPPPLTPARQRPSISSSRRASPPENRPITLSDGSVAQIPRNIYDYYLEVVNADPNRMVQSIEKRGVEGFIRDYGQIVEEDKERRGGIGGSVLGTPGR